MAKQLLSYSCLLLYALLLLAGCKQRDKQSPAVDTNDLFVRIAEIEIEPDRLEGYLAILQEEAEASVRLEPGVISIFPMYVKAEPNAIRILEIYADEAAYREHLQTPHFKYYKESTADMVKSLKLVEMQALDDSAMPLIFKKLLSGVE